MRSREESNLNHKLRKLAFYPLNYGSSRYFVSQTEHIGEVGANVCVLFLLPYEAAQIRPHCLRPRLAPQGDDKLRAEKSAGTYQKSRLLPLFVR